MSKTPPLHINLEKALLAASLATRRPAVVFEWGECSVELFIPRDNDNHSIHDQDELYFVAAGRGTFRRNGESVEFSAGDMLFVPAGTEHRFETFTNDFKTWAVFFGSPGGAQPPEDAAA